MCVEIELDRQPAVLGPRLQLSNGNVVCLKWMLKKLRIERNLELQVWSFKLPEHTVRRIFCYPRRDADTILILPCRPFQGLRF